MADLMGMMKQAAQLQAKMKALQAELDTIEVEGVAGGGVVAVTLTGEGRHEGRAHRPFADESRARRKSWKIFWSPLMPTPRRSRKASCRKR